MPLPDASLFDEGEILDGLLRWVAIESPTYDAAAVNRMMSAAARDLAEIGARIETLPGQEGYGDIVLARFAGRTAGPGILVLAHLDTVHLVGTLERGLPMRRDGDRYYGPGIYDMKGGTYIAYQAMRQLLRSEGAPTLPVTFMLIPDEEIGSPTTRARIEAEARANKYVLVPEPAQDKGNLITGRWAFARFFLKASGQPAHAGANLGTGRSAIREMAEQIPRIETMSRPEDNVVFTVGKVHGGTYSNVVPTECSAEMLAIAETQADLDQVRAQMMALGPLNEGIAFTVTEGPVRPLFEASEETMRMYELARDLSREAGYEVGHGSVGAGSDGNFTGALGIPTLDGLGVCGDGFHTLGEHILVSSLVPRARVFGGLLSELR
ncbi:M20/M25/M40 family metallo-hydrolase [Methyloligella sp. 2.7D]|uniref:M20/M25/M40 family metallo-hydrolase n=1 Tax=unclassified Methyloligella TaxID=2625955 RepID=UPI00157C14C9|nr:M20/M25/M40 family metallo-hydrolase [Methyloligella sp. GL2]QKP77930.1 M20/M25/M40 family metallo-hydrolase [Methyloligella sp. GL2]